MLYSSSFFTIIGHTILNTVAGKIVTRKQILFHPGIQKIGENLKVLTLKIDHSVKDSAIVLSTTVV